MAGSSRAAARAPFGVPMPPGPVAPEALVASYRRLAEVFHHVLSEQSLDTLLDRVADTLAELMPYSALHIYEAHEELGELVPLLARGDYHDEVMRDRPRFGEGITGWAVVHREPVWANDAHLDPRVETIPGTPVEPEAMITVPLVARGALKGALNIYRDGGAGFSEDEFDLAKWFADAAALALDNAKIRAELEHQAQTDSLTGLYNHRYFHERLRSELTRASRSHDSVAILMLDIDDFKRVNDIYGHGAGDQLLIQVAGLAREIVRGSDVVCRVGGEEFAIIMTSCDAGDALGLAARLTERLREHVFEPSGRITVSIVACAEAAMMTAKVRGKNNVVVFDESDGERPTNHSTTSRDVRSIAHLKMLQSLAGKLNRLNAVREIGETIATELRLLIDYHNCRVFLREGDELAPIAFVGDLDTTMARGEALKTRVGQGITGRCVATGEPVLVPNALECEFASRIPGTAELEESLAAVPLRYGARVTGAIVISSLGVDQFDEDDIRLLEVLAGQASVALENARLYEAQRREAENAKALLRFAERISRAPSFGFVSRDTVDAAAELFDARHSSLWLQDTDGLFSCVASHGFAGDESGTFTATRVPADAVARWVAGRTEPFLASAEESRAALPPAGGRGWQRALIAPLLSGDGVDGWIAVRTEVEELSEEMRLLLVGLAYHASTALRKARLYERQKESAEVANALLDASRELATAEGADELLARIVEVTSRVLGTGRSALWIQEDSAPHELVARSSVGYAARHEDIEWTRYPVSLAREWLERTDPYILTPGDMSSMDGVPDETRARRYAIAPLRIEGNRVGALTADIGDREFDDRELRLLAGLAHQAKLAIESAANYESLERTFVSTVEALANALEAKDEYTSSHARWITDMALLVGRELDLDREGLKRLELGALFHDIGKIGIPSEILQKPGPLTDEEFEIIKEHPELGARILEPIDRLADVCPIVRACHERWDGQGYPDGKAGVEIPIEARIVLVCDAFHAMTSDRPYRKRLDDEVAVGRLSRAAGTQFDPDVVDAFVRLFEHGRVLSCD
jgi:diguanylate cyclase (GGDEF)-like protein